MYERKGLGHIHNRCELKFLQVKYNNLGHI